MSEEMQPIDPVTAAMLMWRVPEPCEPITEISHKVLTRLMNVVEFGDQLERVEKDRLLAHLKEVLAADQPELWAMHSPGPGEVHPMISKEAAEQQAAELVELLNGLHPTVPITINVIPSPYSPLEHFEILAEETIQNRDDLLEHVKELKEATKALATDATLDKFRASGLTIDGDNAYKRDLLDAVVGAMMLGRHNTNPPPAGHWAQRFWDIGREYAELPGAIVLPMPVMPEQPEDAIDDSWMDGYNAALRMREECQRAIEASGLAAPVVNQQLTTGVSTGGADDRAAFEREDRYIVIKRSDLKLAPVYLQVDLSLALEKLSDHLPGREYVVIESDWPEYQIAWQMIESRVTGAALTGAPKSCVWTEDADSFIWTSACGNTWSFIDGGPEDNSMHFCNRCGGALVVDQQEVEALADSDESEQQP